jgi:hypothetical protein
VTLIGVNEFLQRFSKGSAPHAHTVRRWIDQRLLPGLKIGGRYYVDEDALFAMGNPIVEKVLRDVSRSA